jgi:glycosyltransferase involved in cell wall biosynthesis
LIFASSCVLADRLRRGGKPVELLANVADVALFSTAVSENLPEPIDLRAILRPRAVYVGNLAAYRINFDWLLALARELPQVQQIYIGAIGLGDVSSGMPKWDELRRLPNVHVLGPKRPNELPAYLRHCDVAMIPFLDNDHTRGSLPLKLWEYVAAGLPVVATDLPNFAEAARDGAVTLARDEASFTAAVAAIQETPDNRAQRSALAKRHDWSSRIEHLSALLASATRRET